MSAVCGCQDASEHQDTSLEREYKKDSRHTYIHACLFTITHTHRETHTYTHMDTHAYACIRTDAYWHQCLEGRVGIAELPTLRIFP